MISYDAIAFSLLALVTTGIFSATQTPAPAINLSLLILAALLFALVNVGLFALFHAYRDSVRLLTQQSYQQLTLILSSSSLIFALFIHHVFFAISIHVYATLLIACLLTTLSARFFAVWLLTKGAKPWISDARDKRGAPQPSLTIAVVFDNSSSLKEIHTLRKNSAFNLRLCIDLDQQNHRAIAGIPIIHKNQLNTDTLSDIDFAFILPLNDTNKTLNIEKELKSIGCNTAIYHQSMRSIITQHQPIETDQLIGRETIPPNPDLLAKLIYQKSVLVTGAGGSIGSEISIQVLKQRPARLVILDHSEFNLYQIEQQLHALTKTSALSVDIIPILGSVTHLQTLRNLLSTYQIQTIYHAAAYKHVPIVEQNLIEGVNNNVIGTLNTALAACDQGVHDFVLVSTDKAVRPTNIMGASKRMCELICQALAMPSSDSLHGKTKFSIVRFGNVLGSSGSVIPKFLKQIENHGPVTVTHPDVVRYFMSIPEAAALVIQAGAMGGSGEVFVLDMGEPINIASLAKRLIEYKGHHVKQHEGDKTGIDIIYTGLRPGEKLYEELLIGGDVAPSDHSKIFKSNEAMLPWAILQRELTELQKALNTCDSDKIISILMQNVTGFTPSSSYKIQNIKVKNSATHPLNDVTSPFLHQVAD
ncbi:MAG: polysaccharide biosynthesis protein [Cellvibrionales bacterium]|nr:polysaccharide biosynthesis protein [Cellvibrionales bacterium]